MDFLRIESAEPGFVVLVETKDRDDSTKTHTINEAAAILAPVLRPEWNNLGSRC